MSKKPFEKFINKESTGAKKKEEIRQQKRKIKAEARAAGDEARKRKWEQQRGIVSDDRQQSTNDRKGFKKQDSRFNSKDSNKSQDKKFSKDERGNKFQSSSFKKEDTRFKKEDSRNDEQVSGYKSQVSKKENLSSTGNQKPETEKMPLNKFVAYCGICGRREAAELIKKGVVTVNGDVIYEPGHKVFGNEDVKVKGKKIFLQHNLVYILLNKPKDYITTAKDPEGRKTVFDLIKGATKERVYPVGRLDRNTSGVLLITNDGELTQKLTHPSFEIKKIYEVKLDKQVTKKDLEAIVTGIELEDGFIKADSAAYVDAKDKSVIGIEIHSGRNRIVRRIFEHLGYDVRGLDRVLFANLTKKNVDRSKWRMLNEKEVRLLKFMNQSFIKNKTAANKIEKN
jgi:23S rRNA pseudouridine2605 synthase